jgi:hypothetical protein
MAVPYTFGTATAAIPLSQLDSNFATAITLGNTAVYLGNTTTSIGNLTLTNVTISSGEVTTGNVSVAGNVTLTGGTANGVAYLNGSKVLTTGSALVFDGSKLSLGTTSNTSQYIELNCGATANNQIRFFNNGSYYGGLIGATSIGGIQIAANAVPISFSIDSGSTKAMTLDASGNLVVGATSTRGTYKLDIRSDTSIAIGSNATYFGTIGYNGGTGLMSLAAESGGGINFLSGATERMRMASTGIVTMSAYGAGAATFSAAGVISSVSDETWKIKDGVPVDPDSMLKKLEPGYWYYNDEKKEIFGVDRQLGFYAQNVNSAIGPEAAPEPEEGKPWGYYDRSVLAVTVMSLQKALATIETLTARITALESA